MGHKKTLRPLPPTATKLPVFDEKHPRPRHAPADGIVKTPVPLDPPIVDDARRVAAIHARQVELVSEISKAEEALKLLIIERETLLNENVKLRDSLSNAIQPDAWAHAAVAARR